MDAILESLEIGASLFYKALWPILLGVLITALVDTFVDQDRMAQILGGEDAKTTGKATVFGAISSACTFGAVTITQTLFKKGASPHSSFAFSFASTNLVFELGILIYVLLGWAFLAAELLGGFVLITIMYALVRLTLPRATFEQARQQLRDEGSKTKSHASAGDWKLELRRRRGWRLVAVNYFQTMGRIWRSVVFGFLLAGFVVGLIPSSIWAGLFRATTPSSASRRTR